MYGVAIDSVTASSNDPLYEEQVQKFLAAQYGDKLTELEILAKSSRDKPSVEAPDGKFEKDRQGALTKVIEELNRPSDKDAGKPAPDDPFEFDRELGEFTGATSIITSILQFSNPRLAHQMQFQAENTARIVAPVHAYKLGQLGKFALASGVVGIAVGIMQDGVDADDKAETFRQLQQIAEAINNLAMAMQTGFQQLDRKLSALLSFTIIDAARVEQSLDAITNLTTQISLNLQTLEGGLEQQQVASANARYHNVMQEFEADTRRNCILTSTPNASSDCLRHLSLGLVFASRDSAAEGRRVAETENGVAFIRHDDAAEDALVAALIAKETRERHFTVGKVEEVANGLPDPVAWLKIAQELRRRVDAGQLSLALDPGLSLRIYLDALELTTRFDALDSELYDEWLSLGKSLERIDWQIKNLIEKYRYFRTSGGVPWDMVKSCSDCTYIGREKLDELRSRGLSGKDLADFEVSASPALTSRKLEATFWDAFSKKYLNRIGSVAQYPPLQGDARGSEMLLDYSSLPDAVRKKLNIPDIEKLHQSSTLRLYARIYDIEQGGYFTQFKEERTGPCDPIEPGTWCITSVYFTGSIDIVASLAPDVSYETLRDAGLLLWNMEKEWQAAFPVSRSYTLFSKQFNIKAPRPILPSAHPVVRFSHLTWNSLLNFVAHAMSAEDVSFEGSGDLDILRSQIAEAETRRVRFVQDLYIALTSGETGGDTSPPHQVLSDADALQIKAEARDVLVHLSKLALLGKLAFGSRRTDIANADEFNVSYQACVPDFRNVVDLLTDRLLWSTATQTYIFPEHWMPVCDKVKVSPTTRDLAEVFDDWQFWWLAHSK